MSNKITDRNLVYRINNSDQNAFELLFRRYWEMMYRKAIILCVDEDDAMDVVQEVFIDLWERRVSINGIAIKFYLLKATKYGCYNKLKKKKKDFEFIITLSEQEKYFSFFQTQKEEGYKIKAIKKICSHMPKRCKQILKLRFEHNLTNGEIADELNISIRTVETQISNSYKLIKQAFTK